MTDRAGAFAPFKLPGGDRVIHRGPGVVELVPVNPASGAAATLISAGIHGNETAPLELLLGLASDLDNGCLTVGAPVLLAVGHPASIVAGKRYIDTNLNRLFTRPAVAGDGVEHGRALQLMEAADAFWGVHGGPTPPGDQRGTPLHLDLHTSIRDSKYPLFAVEPCADVTTPASLWHILAGAGLQAVLSQHEHSPTFSHYSRAVHGIIAFTLELGRVAELGSNDLNPLAAAGDWLAARVAGVPAAQSPLDRMAFFDVVMELFRYGDDFTLGFDAGVANFDVFQVGTLIARDSEAGDTIVADSPVHVVFPNARVERGARAALLARPAAAPHALE